MFYVPDKLAAGIRYLNDYHDWREKRLARGFADAGELTCRAECGGRVSIRWRRAYRVRQQGAGVGVWGADDAG